MFDTILIGGQVVDGLGHAMFRADVGIENGHITAVGDLSAAEAARTLDCTGLVVSPGWVDIHHPGNIGVFPRVLGQFVREEKIISLEDAVRRMTSFAMQRVGITDRGMICPGAWADITVFNKDTVALRSKDADPQRLETFYPMGISYVLVNGQMVMEGHIYTGARAGQVLRKA